MIFVEKINDNINKYLKYKFLYDLTCNIGNIKELDDKIICYVDQKLLKKQKNSLYYNLICDGINKTDLKMKELAEKFDLNKPLYYIFDNIKFDIPLHLSTNNSYVVFKNCRFFNGIRFFSAEDVTLESNEYIGLQNSKDKAFFCGDIKNLTLNGDNFINFIDSDSYNLEDQDNFFGMDINIENLYINDSHIVAEKKGCINIRAQKMEIYDSEIEGPEIYLDVDSINSNNSSFEAYNGIIIDNKDEDCNIEVINKKSPIIYNGIEIPKFDDYHIIINQKIYDEVKKNSHNLKKINR